MRCSSILCVRAIARSEVLHCCDAVALAGGLMQWQRYFYATTSSSRTRTPRSRNPRKRRPRFVGEACLSFAERLKPGARSWKNASRALTHHFLFFSWGASEASSRQQQKRIHTIRRSSNTLRRSELRGIQLFFLSSVGFSFSIAAAALKNTLILWPRTEVSSTVAMTG